MMSWVVLDASNAQGILLSPCRCEMVGEESEQKRSERITGHRLDTDTFPTKKSHSEIRTQTVRDPKSVVDHD